MAGDVAQWLEALGLGQYAESFAANDIDFRALPHLSEDDLKELGVSLGHRRVLLAAIAGSAQDAGSAQPGPEAPERPRHGEAQRRQLTVMFVDLVGSTELSRRLDPEDLREVMRRYQEAVAEATTRYNGHVAKYLGDGVLAYFGWPQAYEDQAERAIRAGLDAVTAVQRIDPGGAEPLRARAGVASGQVVVGDLSGETDAISGETPNLAARLQQLARPGQVVIAESTQRLVAGTFSVRPLDAPRMKGFAEPVAAFAVAAEMPGESRFEARRRRHLTRFVGRGAELALLHDRWSMALQGEGQVVLVAGEAGIGKSRLVEEFRQMLAGEQHVRLTYQCSPYHTNSAFHPVIRQLEHAAGIGPRDDDRTKLEKLKTVLETSGETRSKDLSRIASLLSIAVEGRDSQPEGNVQQRKRELLEALSGQLLALGQRAPVLFFLEDAHWLDPSTAEWIEHSVDVIADCRLLALITQRPEWRAPFVDKPNVTILSVNRLARADAARLTQSVAAEAVPEPIITGIVEQTDGVPLYVEELTRAVLEAGLSADATEGLIPESLQASLTARLDRLGDAREVAQIASVIGRTFPLELLQEVSGMPGEELARKLSALETAGLIHQARRIGEETFVFKHALIQDTARESLLRRRRRELHARIAAILEESHADVVAREPEVLAQHWSEAGQLEKAVTYGQKAGALALARSAIQEARSHYQAAIDLIGSHPNSADYLAEELDCRIALGPILLFASGAGEALTRHYEETEALAEAFGDDVRTYEVKWGRWWSEHFSLGDVARAGDTARELIEIGQRRNDRGMLLQAYHSAWTSGFLRDPVPSVVEHLQAGLALYDLEEHRSHIAKYGGHDAGCCAHNFLAMCYCLLGKLDSAARHNALSIANAQRVEHEFTEVFTHSFGCTVYHLRRDYEEIIKQVADLERVIHGNPTYLHFVTTPRLLSACARALLERGEDTLRGVDAALSVIVDSGFPRLAFQYAAAADTHLKVGALDRADELAKKALEAIETTGETRWLADVHRVRGDVAAARGRDHWELAKASYAEALRVARAQGAPYFELRTATPLARLWHAQGRTEEARALLEPVYQSFSEGLDLPDMVDARELIKGLN